MEYTVIQASRQGDLIHQVNLHMDFGWLPLGGVCVSNGGYGGYYQAMTRTKDTDK